MCIAKEFMTFSIGGKPLQLHAILESVGNRLDDSEELIDSNLNILEHMMWIRAHADTASIGLSRSAEEQLEDLKKKRILQHIVDPVDADILRRRVEFRACEQMHDVVIHPRHLHLFTPAALVEMK